MHLKLYVLTVFEFEFEFGCVFLQQRKEKYHIPIKKGDKKAYTWVYNLPPGTSCMYIFLF